MSKYKPKPRDGLGAHLGTIAASVNQVMSKKWQTVEQIQKQAGHPMKSIKRRLYHGTQTGLYDYERAIRFKLKKQKAPKQKAPQ